MTPDPVKQERLTRFLIYITEDQGRTLTLIGEQLAKSSEDARKAFFDEPTARRFEGKNAVTVSENYARLKPVTVETKISFGDDVPVAKHDEIRDVSVAESGGAAVRQPLAEVS